MSYLFFRVTYIFRPETHIEPKFGLLPGYCIMSLEPANVREIRLAMNGGQYHELKCLEPYFSALVRGDKKHELRKDDRTPRFEIGDVLKIVRYE